VFTFIAAEKTGYPVAVMCRALEVNRTSFHDWERRAPSSRALTDAWLTEKIKEIHDTKRRVYGAPRIHAELRMAHGIRVGRKRVERLMSSAGISGLVPKKRGRTTIRVPGVRVADDLVERQFKPDAPNVLWLADITYLRTRSSTRSSDSCAHSGNPGRQTARTGSRCSISCCSRTRTTARPMAPAHRSGCRRQHCRSG
jgi:putative transposase